MNCIPMQSTTAAHDSTFDADAVPGLYRFTVGTPAPTVTVENGYCHKFDATKLAKVLSESVPREVFENYKETQAEAAKIVAETLAEERGARAGGQRLMAVMLFLFALASLILKFLPVGT